ncbi:ABC transporter permease [Thorsellia anophelis]|uniref:Putative ABC transport system permease protein n=1 Tax=Thorsellia anophelis DSM 18579 TaxID=1123402 RepID=A0A1H9ZR81_9GAMM|nr:FtsX-like permease family protein [Thorsellia anophelis]SES84216.1 putative ABC transport system permease protein [Thorsellia anophelis DSM 18579]
MSNLCNLPPKLGWIARGKLLLRLAYKDLLFDRKIALCIIFALVSVIAPLMLLFGLKNGIVTQLNQKLLNDPRNIEIVILGNKNYPLSLIEDIRARNDVQFVIPLTRSLNTHADLFKDSKHFAENVEMIPTDKGDPILGMQASRLNDNEIILTLPLADKLNVSIGESVSLFVSRKLNSQLERGKQDLVVKDILNTNYFGRLAGFISINQLIDMEDYRDGFFVKTLSATTGGTAPERTHFAKFRLFASTLEDVAPLAKWLNSQNIETQTKSAEIENVQAISYVLGFVFNVIAWITFLGCAASLSGAFLANIDRKRKDMAIMRLMGFTKRSVTVYITMQSIILTTIAYLIACGLYAIGSHLFNQALGGAMLENQFASYLTYQHYLIAFGISFSIALFVATLGTIRASRIEPAESLREI